MVIKLRIILACCLLISYATGCDTKNVGSNWWRPPEPVIQHSTFTADTTWNGGLTATLTIDWGGTGIAPYTLIVDMGGGVVETPNNGDATTPFIQTFTLVEADERRFYSWSATLTDKNGRRGYATGSYFVDPPIIPPPTIDSVTFADGLLTVTVSNADGYDMEVSVTGINGLSVDTTRQRITGGSGDAVFRWTAEDVLAGGTGDTTISAYYYLIPDIEVWQSYTITIDPVVYELAEG